jgi:hypothetical protein
MSIVESLRPAFDREMATTRRLTERVPSDKAEWRPHPGYTYETTETLLKGFDANVREAREALAAAKDGDLSVMWSLKRGDKVFMQAPRGAVVRMHNSHLSRRRGQLTVYLRLPDVPIPSIYGPTADERM